MEELDHERRLRVVLTDADVNELARKSARLTGEARRLRDDKKTTVKFYAAEIGKREDGIDEISTAIENGYMERQVRCAVMLNSPRAGYKTIVRLDTGEVVDQIVMDEMERQSPLEFVDPAKTTTEEPPPSEENQEEQAPEEATAAAEPTPLYIEDSTCNLCQGGKNIAGGALVCPECLGDGRQRLG